MKKLQIICRPKKIDEVMNALSSKDVGGLTLSDVQGQGRAEPPLVGDTFSMKQIITVVPDDKVKEIFDAVSSITCSSTKGDGKIFVTEVVDAIDFCTQKTGSEAI